MMRRLPRVLPALLLALAPVLAPAIARADDEATKFIRFKEKGGSAALDIAQATYRSEKTGAEVVLYGVVHIADEDYYKAVQQDLDAMDVVLYEGVTPPKDMKVDESMKGLGEMQQVMGDMLGLQFQKDGINYKAKNLVHADMSMDEMREAAGGDMSKVFPQLKMFSDPKMMKQIAPLMKMFAQFGKGMMKSNPSFRNNMKLQMARQMSGGDISAMGGEEMMRVIVVERNKKALEVLDKELKKRDSGKLAIFYGAAHMKDFHERLAERGFKQVSKEWKTAWKIGKGVSADSDGDEDEDGDSPAKKPETKPEPKATPVKPGKRWL